MLVGCVQIASTMKVVAVESTPRLERCLVAVLDEGEVGRCCRKGLTRAGARLSPPLGAGGPSACRRASAAPTRLDGLPFCSAGNQVLEPRDSRLTARRLFCLAGRQGAFMGSLGS